jgi:predicted ATPase
VLARRLTVFAGGASLAAVAQVCGLPDPDAVDLLASLVDKSLVEAGGGRFRMLDTVRAFGAERLAEAGEEERSPSSCTSGSASTPPTRPCWRRC